MSAIEKRIECLEATARRTVTGPNAVLAAWVETLTDDECAFLLGAFRRQDELGCNAFEASLTDGEREQWLSLNARIQALL